tara:strand:- start:710 stop:1063 length:354 start_codon:yes stop_codon:yes gene_type:complete
MEYNTKYYGSPLNLFIAENCRKDIVVNNIDLIIHDYKNKIITIIESKHDKETIKIGQGILLKKMRSLIPKKINNYIIQILIIRGNYPYNKADLIDVNGTVIKTLNQTELIKFINNSK